MYVVVRLRHRLFHECLRLLPGLLQYTQFSFPILLATEQEKEADRIYRIHTFTLILRYTIWNSIGDFFYV